MTEEQIKIGNRVLEIFMNSGGSLHQNLYSDQLQKEFGYQNNTLINTTINILIEDYKLLRRYPDPPTLKTITSEGMKAYKIGLKKYIENFEKVKITPIKYAKWAIYISGFTLLILIADKTINYINNHRQNTNTNSQLGVKNSHSANPGTFINNTLVKVISDSLKNDSAFIKEIANKLDHNKKLKYK